MLRVQPAPVPRLSSTEPAHARRPSGAARPRSSALRRTPRYCNLRTRSHAVPVDPRRAADRGPHPAARPGGRHAARCRDPPERHDESAFGASDADGAWLWKDSYEAAEAALVLFLQRYGRAMRREAGAGPGGPAAMLRMLETLAGLEPSQTRRTHEQLKYQQFSTPLPLAYAMLQAADDPARRRGARTLGGHRHAGRDGAACARQRSRRRASPQRDRRHPRRAFSPRCFRAARSPATTPSPSGTGCPSCVPPWC